jgi:hypothetical protein
MCKLEVVARAHPNPQVDQEYSPGVWGEPTPELKIKTVIKTNPLHRQRSCTLVAA